MIGSLMYLTASRPDIMFVVCACSRFQVIPKLSHLQAVKRIFRRLISWQCKKQTIVATSTTEAEYVGAANCCRQTEENTEFHQIVDFLSTCLITYALIQIHAIIDGKVVVILELSVGNDLLFNDEDGIACLTNADIFENLALAKLCVAGRKVSTAETKLVLLVTVNAVRGITDKTHKHRNAKKVTELPQTSVPLDLEADEIVYQEGGDNVERAITTDASLVAAHDSDNITKTQSTTMSNDPISQKIGLGHTVGSGEDRMEQEIELTDPVPQTPYDSSLLGWFFPWRKQKLHQIEIESHEAREEKKGKDFTTYEEKTILLDRLIISPLQSHKNKEGKNKNLGEESSFLGGSKNYTRLKLRVTRLEKKRKARTSQPMKRRLFNLIDLSFHHFNHIKIKKEKIRTWERSWNEVVTPSTDPGNRTIRRTCLFSLSERLKADNTVRVNQIVTIFLIESSIQILDQNRYPVDTSLIHLESHKSPTAELFDVDSGGISIHHYEY
nr:retrovirus-related Pol polyprotein from transposon TNT 1-94 [Tanacetum cinerariifolium]